MSHVEEVYERLDPHLGEVLHSTKLSSYRRAPCIQGRRLTFETRLTDNHRTFDLGERKSIHSVPRHISPTYTEDGCLGVTRRTDIQDGGYEILC